MKGEVKAGELRKRIQIQTLSPSRNATGETTDQWTFLAEVWASIEPLSGREAWIAEEQKALVSHRIRIRYMQGINATMRALYDGRYFNFTVVRNIGEWNHTIEIAATEIA